MAKWETVSTAFWIVELGLQKGSPGCRSLWALAVSVSGRCRFHSLAPPVPVFGQLWSQCLSNSRGSHRAIPFSAFGQFWWHFLGNSSRCPWRDLVVVFAQVRWSVARHARASAPHRFIALHCTARDGADRTDAQHGTARRTDARTARTTRGGIWKLIVAADHVGGTRVAPPAHHRSYLPTIVLAIHIQTRPVEGTRRSITPC